MSAIEQAEAQIKDTFRPARNEWQNRITTACRLKQLVQSHRYTFPQALEKLEARTDWMLEAFDFIALDNAALNIKYETETHRLYPHEVEAWNWLKQITGQE